jgi:hypothetical protein
VKKYDILKAMNFLVRCLLGKEAHNLVLLLISTHFESAGQLSILETKAADLIYIA